MKDWYATLTWVSFGLGLGVVAWMSLLMLAAVSSAI
jgi:hypothetical protein